MPVTYETPYGKEYLWLPRNGFILPHKDEKKGVVWFKDGTLVPLETVPFDQRRKVEKRFSEFGMPVES